MGEWKEYTLASVMEIIGGGTPKTTENRYWNGDIPWLSVVDFNTGIKYVSSTEKTITELGLKESSTKMLKEGDIIISARGTVGALAVLKKPMSFNQSCYGLRAKDVVKNNDFLYYLVKQSITEIGSHTYGAVFDTITKQTFDNIQILLPPPPEQEAIAEVLSSLDDKIDLLHSNNKTLEQLAETLFKQWFGECTEEEKSLSEIIDVRDGTHDSPKPVEHGKLLITSKNLKPTGLDFTNAYPISDRDYELVNRRSKVELNDLLFSMIGTLGLLHLVEEEPDYAIKNMGLFKTSGKPWFSRYLYLLLSSPLGKNFIYENAIGTTQEYITLGSLRGFKFPYPGEDLIKNFDKLVVPLFEKRSSNTKQIRKLQTLRDTLLPKLMSGEVRVKLN